MAGPGFGPFFKDESFPGKAAKSEFESRQRILLANLGDKFFTACTIDMGTPGNNGVLLQEFALWAVDKLGWSVPLELLGLAEKERKAREDKARELEEQQEDEGFLASLEETIYNGKAISWRYWAYQMPSLTAAQAARLMSALDPDIFEELGNRPNRNDPTQMCQKAKAMQRLAETEGVGVQSARDWLKWADERGFKVHRGFRLAANAKGAELEISASLRETTGLKESDSRRLTRQDAISPIIEKAIQNAEDGANVRSVWTTLTTFAQTPARYPPLIGLAEGEIKYENSNGDVKALTLKNLRGRLNRRRQAR